ncbi:MAG TPA: molecular chaperone TorD family protein [Eggerthellaceae bacterium]|nr:molecular chaperone TorD family protein [Eggerthellaceae bacterium]
MGLARRTYLYRLFHVVFRKPPDRRGRREGARRRDAGPARLCGRGAGPGRLRRSGGPDARPVRAQPCRLRRRRPCLGPSGRRAKRATRSAPRLSPRACAPPYDRLFQVPGEHYVHPWESPYTGKESVVFQESTLDVRSFYHAAGFKLRAEKRFPDDHIAAMMDYLGALSQRAYEAFADGRDDEAARTLATQRQFVDRHLLNWVDQFAAKVIEHDAQGCYGALAGGMAAFAALDRVLSEQVEAELAEPE